ncbi:MAG: hypothetical protein WCX14_10410, partial [Dysgonamonadaceae bacterium]
TRHSPYGIKTKGFNAKHYSTKDVKFLLPPTFTCRGRQSVLTDGHKNCIQYGFSHIFNVFVKARKKCG